MNHSLLVTLLLENQGIKKSEEEEFRKKVVSTNSITTPNYK
jgi:hypothetical protein